MRRSKFFSLNFRSLAFNQIKMLSDDNCVEVLQPGFHLLLPIRGLDGPHCGLIPLAGPVRSVSSSGLTWNVSESRMEMGVFVSVCNLLLPSAYLEDRTLSAIGDDFMQVISSTKDTIIADVCKCELHSSFINCSCEYGKYGVRIDTSDAILWTCELSK